MKYVTPLAALALAVACARSPEPIDASSPPPVCDLDAEVPDASEPDAEPPIDASSPADAAAGVILGDNCAPGINDLACLPPNLCYATSLETVATCTRECDPRPGADDCANPDGPAACASVFGGSAYMCFLTCLPDRNWCPGRNLTCVRRQTNLGDIPICLPVAPRGAFHL